VVGAGYGPIQEEMMLGRKYFAALFVVCLFFAVALAVHAQGANSGTISGMVKDPSGAAVPNAIVEIQYVVSGFDRTAKTDNQGGFAFSNVPFNSYHLTVKASGFADYTQDVDLRSSVPVSVGIGLKVAGSTTTVTITGEAADLIENTSTDHTDVDKDLFDKVPLESQSSSLSSLVTLTTAGVAADSNGLFHGLGDHASNSFSVDGQPITDQQSKIFSNQLPSDAVQSLEVIEGAPPAEYGDKTSLVIVATTRSGLGVTEPHGSITSSYGSFGTPTAGFDFLDGGAKWGNFVSLSGLDTGRFLDGPELTVIHDKGNEENFFDRVDFKLSDKDTLQLNLGFTRSWIQNPNSFDAENATGWIPPAGLGSPLVVDVSQACPAGQTESCGGVGPNGLPIPAQDQRSQIRTFNLAPTFTHLISTTSLATFGAFYRQDEYNYYPSADPFSDLTPGLQTQSIAQDRRLSNAGLRGDYSYVKGVNNLKAGITYEQTFITENDFIGIVDPTFNPVCDNADGSININPLIVSQTQCGGALNPGGSADAAFQPLLACLDLTRSNAGAHLPVSDGCSAGQSVSAPDFFRGHGDIKELSMYVQDTISKDNWSFNLGIRGDLYNGFTVAAQPEPRLGVAYNVKKTGTVLRISYARTMETPFNENLALASEGCNDPVINLVMATVQGYPCLNVPLAPGWRNEFHAGFEQAFGRYFVLSGEYIWKYTHYAYDFSVLGNTPITFPIEWQSSKIPGYTVRGSLPNFHGVSAYVVMAHVAARFFGPQVTGIGATPSGAGNTAVFRIDHDENFDETTHVQYQPWKRGPWFGFNWRYDSGLVAGPVPCAGDLNSVVDVSGLSPDQQFEAGLFCGSVKATPTTPISSSLGADLCPASSYGSNLVKIPAAGTENDDHNPPRIAPRNLFDATIGDDNLFGGERRKWSLRFTVINLTNKVALYNFLSTFSGTHYVSPRTETVELGFHF
jgi:hypothetical protein